MQEMSNVCLAVKNHTKSNKVQSNTITISELKTLEWWIPRSMIDLLVNSQSISKKEV